MAGNYEKSIYNQLMEVMARLDSVEKDYKKDVNCLNDKIDELTEENHALRKENKLLRDDNARLKSIINNDSSNTSLPPPSTKRAENLPILLMVGQRQNVKVVDKKGIKERHLPKQK
jgi:transposase